jgi:hypothetical protein
MMLAGWFAALRGEEIVRIDVGQIRKHWDEGTLQEEAPHIPLMLSGQFKRKVGEKVFCQTLAMESKSGVKIGQGFWRALDMLAAQNVTSGPLFRVMGKEAGTVKRATTADLNPNLIDLLERVRKHWSNVFGEGVNIWKEFSIGQSLRRGVTAGAQNAGISKEVIEANNRWRKHPPSKGLSPGMTMMERYSDDKASVPTLVKFSKELLQNE